MTNRSDAAAVPARRRIVRVGLVAGAVTAVLTLAGCGDISRSDAVSQLQTQFASSSIPTSLATCIVGRLFDSGKFSNDEIQKVLKANSSSDLGADLNQRYTDNVQTPCLQQLQGGSSTSTTTTSTAATSS